MVLDPLPPSTDEYWKEADINKHEVSSQKCEHYFAQVASRQIECQKCHIGFYTSPSRPVNIKDGHIYKGKKLIV